MTVPAPGTKVPARVQFPPDRKSTRLNSSHDQISYAVFCLKKKKKPQPTTEPDNMPPSNGTPPSLAFLKIPQETVACERYHVAVESEPLAAKPACALYTLEDRLFAE